MLVISLTWPSRNCEEAESRARATAAQPRTAGPNRFAKVTSSALENNRLTGSGSPRANADAARWKSAINSSNLIFVLCQSDRVPGAAGPARTLAHVGYQLATKPPQLSRTQGNSPPSPGPVFLSARSAECC